MKLFESLSNKTKSYDIPFKHFEYKAFATGSIGQVHMATLDDGTEVVVKLVPKNEQDHQERPQGLNARLCVFFRTFLHRLNTGVFSRDWSSM